MGIQQLRQRHDAGGRKRHRAGRERQRQLRPGQLNGAAATLRGGSFTGRGGQTPMASTTMAAARRWRPKASPRWARTAAATTTACTTQRRGGDAARRFLHRARGDNRLWHLQRWQPARRWRPKASPRWARTAAVANYGLRNSNGAAATLRGGSFTGRRGDERLWHLQLTALRRWRPKASPRWARMAAASNNGLRNYNSATATLRGGSFTGRGGTDSWGIYNYSQDLFSTMLEAESVTALGEDGSSTNYGLHNTTPFATTNITQSVLEGADQSVLRNGGTVNVSNSRLVGGAVSGTVTCVLVTRGTTISTDGSTCP